MPKILSLDIFIQLLINGILFGTMYGIAAIGLSLIFGTMRIMFLAQGSMIILFAYDRSQSEVSDPISIV